jgi:NAD-dependent dihydropyrimidine dehydrogenase PreA subunit
MTGNLIYLKGVTTLELFEDKCTGCGMCVEVCPHGVMKVESGLAVIVDRDACMECSACSRNCPEEAITVEAGVGCAQAVINSALGRSGDVCCGLEDYSSSGSDCGTTANGCESEVLAPKRKRSGCC